MLYQDIVTRKICRVLEFRGIKQLERVKCITPELIRQYLIPEYLKRDVYFGVLLYMFPRWTLSNLEVLINEAYPKKEIYSEEAKAIIKATQIN